MQLYQLSALKVVNFEYDDEALRLKMADLRVYKKFVEKVLRKNPDFDIYLIIRDNEDIVLFPEVRVSLSLQRIRVLLCHCR